MIKFFNPSALLCMLMIFGIVVSLKFFIPSLFTGSYRDFGVSVIVLATGTVAEIFGLRGRVLFIPVWVWGVVMVAVHSYIVWGIAALLPPVLLIVFAVWRIMQATKADEAVHWAKAGVALSELRAAGATSDGATFWRLVSDSLYLPVAGDLTSETCTHNLEVVRIAMDQAMKSNRADLETWKMLASFLEENGRKEEAVSLPFDLKTKVDDLVRTRRAESEHLMVLAKAFSDSLEAQRQTVRRN